MIPLDRIKSCTNKTCRAVLPADPDDEPAAGFWVSVRDECGRVRSFNSQCKDCVRAKNRERARVRRASQASYRPRRPVRLIEHEGRLVQWKVCDCGTEGPCLDGPESIFPVHSRDSHGWATGWRSLCRDCWNAYQREHRNEGLRERENTRRRQRHAERMMSDPDYAASCRRRGRLAYERSSARRERVAEANRRWRKQFPDRVRERDATYRANRAEREGRSYRPRVSMVDGASPRVPVAPFREWLMAYREATGLRVDAELARELGIQERRVRSVLRGEYRRVALDVVDRAVLVARAVVVVDGRSVLRLEDLYPLCSR